MMRRALVGLLAVSLALVRAGTPPGAVGPSTQGEVPTSGTVVEALVTYDDAMLQPSPIDYARFVSAVDGQRGPALLQPATMALATSRPPSPVWEGSPSFYGLGWAVRPHETGLNSATTGACRARGPSRWSGRAARRSWRCSTPDLRVSATRSSARTWNGR